MILNLIKHILNNFEEEKKHSRGSSFFYINSLTNDVFLVYVYFYFSHLVHLGLGVNITWWPIVHSSQHKTMFWLRIMHITINLNCIFGGCFSRQKCNVSPPKKTSSLRFHFAHHQPSSSRVAKSRIWTTKHTMIRTGRIGIKLTHPNSPPIIPRLFCLSVTKRKKENKPFSKSDISPPFFNFSLVDDPHTQYQKRLFKNRPLYR